MFGFDVGGLPDPELQQPSRAAELLSKTWLGQLVRDAASGVGAFGEAAAGRVPVTAGMRREDLTDIPGTEQPVDPWIKKVTDAGAFAMTGGLWLATIFLYFFGLSSAAWFVVLLGLIGFFALGPDSLLSGAGAMDVGPRRQAIVAAATINGLGSLGPLVEEPAIGWLMTHVGLDAVLRLLDKSQLRSAAASATATCAAAPLARASTSIQV